MFANAMGGLFTFGYLAMGLVQLVATVEGLDVWFDLEGFFAYVVAFILAYFPIVGSVCGFFGALHGWDWPWYSAAALFLGVPVVAFFIAWITSHAEHHS